jgi:magnesium transporter
MAYRSGQRLGDTSIDEISDVIKKPDTFMWLGLHEPDDALLLKIQREFGLHELAINDAHHARQRRRLSGPAASAAR